MIQWSWWYLLLLGALQAFVPARSDRGSAAADDVETPGSAETEDSGAMQEEISIPADLAEMDAAQDQRIKRGWVEIISGTARLLQGHMLEGSSTAISAVKVHMCGICRIYELSIEQSGDAKKHLKRLYEYTKKAMGFDGALIIALNQQNLMSNSSNIAFKVSLLMLLVTFSINLIIAILLMVGSFNLAFKYPIYISSVIGMFMPFVLLVSYGQLHPYMILISLLPFFSITLFHGAVTDGASELLDHIFDMSAAAYALLAAGCVLGNPYFISKESVAASPLACSLFLTIFIARYLMLISTLRPPVIVEHAETLMFILKLLLALTAIFVTVEFIGWELALVALSLGAVDAVFFSMSLLAHIPGTTTSGDMLISYDQRKEQQLLSAVFVVTLFTIIVTKAYSEYAAAQEVSMGSAAKLGMLLCICAFLCSLNRMLITRAHVVVAAPPKGGYDAVKVLSTLELARASVVAVAALYIIYKIGSSACLHHGFKLARSFDFVGVK